MIVSEQNEGTETQAPMPTVNYSFTILINDSVTVNISKFEYKYGLLHACFTVIILSCFILSCAIGNLLVVTAILLERNLQSVSNYLIFSLAAADLMVSILVLPVGVINEVSKAWWLGLIICDIWVCLDVMCCTASILNLVAIALDRYWAVTHVDYIRKRSPQRLLTMIGIVWAISITVSVPSRFHMSREEMYETQLLLHGLCLINTHIFYTIFSTLSAFYLPMFLLMAIYARIYITARRHIRKKRFQCYQYQQLPSKFQAEQQTAMNKKKSENPVVTQVVANGGSHILVNKVGTVTTALSYPRDVLKTARSMSFTVAEPSTIINASSKEASIECPKDESIEGDSDPGSKNELPFHISQPKGLSVVGDSWCTTKMEPFPVANDVPHVLISSVLTDLQNNTFSTCRISQNSQLHDLPILSDLLNPSNDTQKTRFIEFSSLTNSPRLYRPHIWMARSSFCDFQISTAPPCLPVRHDKPRMWNVKWPNIKLDCFHSDKKQVSLMKSIPTSSQNGTVYSVREYSVQGSEEGTCQQKVRSRPKLLPRRQPKDKAMSTKEKLEHKRERKAARTLSIITGCFIVCWLPFFGNVLMKSIFSYEEPELVMSILLWLGYTNSLLNPVIYTIFSPEFRLAFQKIIRSVCHCHR